MTNFEILLSIFYAVPAAFVIGSVIASFVYYFLIRRDGSLMILRDQIVFLITAFVPVYNIAVIVMMYKDHTSDNTYDKE